jgi:hypothetical protein
MPTLIYKRTYKGDAGERGRFGVWDRIGSVRGRRFDAVIDVGWVAHPPPGRSVGKFSLTVHAVCTRSCDCLTI